MIWYMFLFFSFQTYLFTATSQWARISIIYVPMQYWYNYQLVWDPKDYGGIEVIYLQPQDVWVPDVLLYNK